jgi:dTDP-4-dehydrorhamnose 3,5-epimerase-like enzyme
MVEPYIIKFKNLGTNELGYLNIGEVDNEIPFSIQRIFWTHALPNNVIRGHHAHKKTCQILIAINGAIKVTTEKANGETQVFELTNSQEGLFLPPHVWHTMLYSDNAVQLVMCSEKYDEADYLRDHNEFKIYYK